MFYSKSTNGFYDPAINKNIPQDAVKITREAHIQLLAEQSNGKKIESDEKGHPIALNESTGELNFDAIVQEMLEKAAKSWGYDSLLSAISYINSTNKKYKSEAKSLISWRDSCWEKAYIIKSENLLISADDFLLMLPKAPLKQS
jgi:hypothetical protein